MKESGLKNMESPQPFLEEDLHEMQDMANILILLKQADLPNQNKNLKRKRFQRSRGSFSDLSDESIDSDSLVDRNPNSIITEENDSKFSFDIFGRKKAPSGTACEKHKKEKKRCPEDCSMRKHNQKFIDSKLQEQKQQISDEENHPSYVSARQIVKMTEELIGKLHQDNWEGTSTKLFHFISSMKDLPSDIEKIEVSIQEPKNKEECMEFIQLIMKQLNEIPAIPREDTVPARVREPLSPKLEEPTSPIDDESSGRKKRRAVEIANYRFDNLENQESPKLKKGTATKACEYHTSVHARCPQNCPDRRQVVKIQKQNSDATLPKPMKVIENSPLESEAEIIAENQSSANESRSPSPNKSSRKYVSVACDRHKLLHARCPANCPDRIAGILNEWKNKIRMD